MPDLRVIYGGGEIVEFLERLMERARHGHIEVIAVATCETEGYVGSGLAFREDTSSPWVRTVGSVASLQHDLLTGRLTFEP